MPTTLFPQRYNRIQNSGPTSKVHWVPLMEVTLTLQPLHHSGIYTETEKALYHKIASLLAHLVFNFAMLSLDGKALPLMLIYGMMPLTMILWFQMENITLQMLVFLLVMSYCFHTEVCATIFQSGDVTMFSMILLLKAE